MTQRYWFCSDKCYEEALSKFLDQEYQPKHWIERNGTFAPKIRKALEEIAEEYIETFSEFKPDEEFVKNKVMPLMRAEQLPLIRTWQLERDCAVAKARTELKECVLDEYLDRYYKEHEKFLEEQDKIDAIGLILAHQKIRSQIDDINVLSSLENCAIKMVNVDAEAPYFSKLLHIPEERMNQLPRGYFAMHVRDEGSSIVQIPRAELPYRRMTDADEKAHQERMIALYGYETHKPPEKEGLRDNEIKSAEADKASVPKITKTLPEKSDPTKPAPWRKV